MDVLLVLSLGFADLSDHVGYLRVFSVLLPLSLLAVAAIVFTWAMCVAFVQRNLVLWREYNPEQEKCLLGKPLFFPSRLTHARMFPEKYHYGIDYFLVGIPVGLRGRVGALMSIDSDGSDPEAQTGSFQSFAKNLFRTFFWFSVDTSQYLHRGDGHLSLTQKLEIFLKERGEDITNYPYAYLITIPQFCWWTKSPISYWYLYSPSKELSAIIMEINNSYGEKKNAFCRLAREENSCFDKVKCSQLVSTSVGRGLRGIETVQFMSSAPTAKYYKGSWDKDIFASPFEKVEGWFNLRFMDPLDPSPEKGGPMHSNMTLMSIQGKPKVSSRLFSCGPPLDPLSASSWKLAMFLLSWSFVIPASIGRIMVEALRIRFRGNMPYLNKPEVKKNNIPRRASRPERYVCEVPSLSLVLPNDIHPDRVLETFFRMYLSSMVDKYESPLEVIYTPAKSLQHHPISMHSPVKTFTSAAPPVLMIQPLTPKFYTNILKYADTHTGFAAETESIPQNCDPVSQRLWVSDPVLLQKLLNSNNLPSGSEGVQLCSVPASRLAWEQEGKPFMDAFTERHCSSDRRRIYRAARIHCYLTETFALGSYRIAAIYGFVLRTIIMRLVWNRLWRMQCNLATVKFADAFMVVAICFLLIRAWEGLTGRFYPLIVPVVWPVVKRECVDLDKLAFKKYKM